MLRLNPGFNVGYPLMALFLSMAVPIIRNTNYMLLFIYSAILIIVSLTLYKAYTFSPEYIFSVLTLVAFALFPAF